MKKNSNPGCKPIKLLSDATSRVIFSSQSISNVFGAVKELLENALDSKATNIEVKLIDFGLRQIEVTDNGCGIDENEIQFMAKPHYTSKMSNHSDLFELTTYGFRGEALAALSAVSEMTITTKTKTMKCSVSSSFDEAGNVTSTRYGSSGTGTTVMVENLFCNLPVRRQTYKSMKRKKEELSKVELFVKHYAVLHPDIRIALYHCNALIFQKPIVANVKSALLHIWGAKVYSMMEYTSVGDENTNISVEAYLPKVRSNSNETCRSTSDGVFLSVNNRPCHNKEVTKLIRQFYSESISQANPQKSSSYPLSYFSIKLPLDQVDVNLEPAKMELLIECQGLVVSLVTRMLSKYYEKISSSPEIRLPFDNTQTNTTENASFNSSSSQVEDFQSSFEDDDKNSKKNSKLAHQEQKNKPATKDTNKVRQKVVLNNNTSQNLNEHAIKKSKLVTKSPTKDKTPTPLPEKRVSKINLDFFESQTIPENDDTSQLDTVSKELDHTNEQFNELSPKNILPRKSFTLESETSQQNDGASEQDNVNDQSNELSTKNILPRISFTLESQTSQQHDDTNHQDIVNKELHAIDQFTALSNKNILPRISFTLESQTSQQNDETNQLDIVTKETDHAIDQSNALSNKNVVPRISFTLESQTLQQNDDANQLDMVSKDTDHAIDQSNALSNKNVFPRISFTLESQTSQQNDDIVTKELNHANKQSNELIFNPVSLQEKQRGNRGEIILERDLDDILNEIDNTSKCGHINNDNVSIDMDQDEMCVDTELLNTTISNVIDNRKEQTFFSTPSMEDEETKNNGPIIKEVFSMSVDEALNPDDPSLVAKRPTNSISSKFPRKTGNISDFLSDFSQLTPGTSDCWSRGTILDGDDKFIEPTRIVPGSIHHTGTKKRSNKCVRSPEDNAPKPKRKILPDQPRITDMISKKIVSRTGISPYVIFTKECKPQVLSENPGASPDKISKVLLDIWENLTEKQREGYVIKATATKDTLTDFAETSRPNATQIDKIIEYESTTSKDSKINNLKFSIDSLKEILTNKRARKASNIINKEGSIKLIGEINKLWFGLSNSKNIVLLDVNKLQELVLYNNLRMTFKLSLVVLRSPIPLDFLSNEKLSSLKKVLNTLPSEKHGNLDPNNYIIDPRLTWNGFFVRRFQSYNDFKAEIWQMSQALPSYGVTDLIEILQSIERNNKIDMKNSRPLKLLMYLKEEAARIAKNTPKNITKDQMRELLKNLKDLPQSNKTDCTRNISVLKT